MHRVRLLFISTQRILILLFAGVCFLQAATPKEDAWKTLRAGIHEKGADKRTQALSALGLITGNPEAIALAEDALADPDTAVRNAAITALGELGARPSLPKIKALLPNADAHTVVTVAAVLKALHDPEGYAIYYEILTGQRKGSGGLLAGIKDRKTLEKMGIEEALGFVPYASIGIGAYNYIKANTSSAADVAAATELALDPDPKVEKALVNASYDGSDPVKVAALRSLARRGNPDVVKDITPEIYSGNSLVSYTAAGVVAHLSDKRKRRKLHDTM